MPLVIKNETALSSEQFSSFECCQYLSDNSCIDGNIRINQIKEDAPLYISNNGDQQFLQLSLIPVKSDSIFINIELFEVTGSDTNRVGNYGGKTIAETNIDFIQRTACIFANK